MKKLYEYFKEDGWVLFLGFILCFQLFLITLIINNEIRITKLEQKVEWLEAQQDNVIETLITGNEK